MENTVHVRVRKASEELGVVFTQLLCGDGLEGNLVHGGCVPFEDLGILPYFLILLFDRNEVIALLGLCRTVLVLARRVASDV